MSIIIHKVSTRKDLHDFIKLPSLVHGNHKEWVPSLETDDYALFDSNKNPAFQHCTTILLLAKEKDKLVGRAMGIINHHYNHLNNENNARFSFLETYENPDVFKALMDHLTEWSIGHGCNRLIGPLGFSDKDPQGFLLEGYDQPTVIITNCSFPYMIRFANDYGMSAHTDLVEYRLTLTEAMTERLRPFADRCMVQNNITVHEFTSARQIKPYIRPVFELINKTYTHIYGFSPVSSREADEFANRYLHFLSPHLIKIITDKNQQVKAFIVAMPDMSQGLKKSKGRLFPIGWYYILKSMKKSRLMVLLLGGIEESMRHKGLDALLGLKLIESARKCGFQYMDSHLIMAENRKMRSEIERLDGASLIKKYRIFQKEIE